ncbi:Tigger transposable element-derived protein 4 [Trichinella spiralis]|uniref:Tigger transposable element-derived protein 4 n=1 Tax=Trichinella spiralis TaxID=6334 RepID=A0A0V1BIK3_TRISP|nr:Tigger transposable element-derived protein 4 [Trichinella spiralis]
MIRKLQRYLFQEHPDIAPTLLQIESKLEVMEAEKRIRRSRQSSEAAAVKLDDEANVHECTEGTADEIVEELLSKSNAKEVLSEEVEDPLDEKLTYSEA